MHGEMPAALREKVHENRILTRTVITNLNIHIFVGGVRRVELRNHHTKAIGDRIGCDSEADDDFALAHVAEAEAIQCPVGITHRG